MEKKITLKINDKEVMMNHFVNDIFINVINGLIDSINKVPVDRDRNVEIKIENK